MLLSVVRTGYTDLRQMVYDLQNDMVTAGYRLLFYRNVVEYWENSMLVSPISHTENPNPEEAAIYVLQSTQPTDPYAVNEPYNIVFMVHKKWWKVFACSPANLKFEPDTDAFYVEEFGEDYWPEPIVEDTNDIRIRRSVGCLTLDNLDDDDSPGRQFLNLDPELTMWPSIRDLEVELGPRRILLDATPLTYRLAITGHGVVFYTEIENLQDRPDAKAWFCIQRPVKPDGTINKLTGRRPLWCVFSLNGGGNPLDEDVNSPEIDTNGIRQFVVREFDIDLPSLACSAVYPNGEHMPIINPMEQVSQREDGQLSVKVPSGLNTWRYQYCEMLDMIGFASADVSANGHYVSEDLYGNGTVTFAATGANRPNNRGMRFFMQSSGPGLDAGGAYNLDLYSRWPNRGGSDQVLVPAIFAEVNLKDAATGQTYPAPYDIEIPFIIDPSSVAVEGLDFELEANSGKIVIPKNSTSGKLYGKILPRGGDQGDRAVIFQFTNIFKQGQTVQTTFNIVESY